MAKKQPTRQGGRIRQARLMALERSVPAVPAATEQLLEEILAALEESDCRCGDRGEIRTAIREALNNAVRHGSRLNPRKLVHVSCRWNSREGLSVVVRDEGQGFDPEKVPDPTAPENLQSFSGRGLYMIRELMDEVEFRDGGRKIHMRRRPRP